MDNSLVAVQPAAMQTVEKTFDSMIDSWFNSDEMFRVREQSKRSYRKSLKTFHRWLVGNGIQSPTKQDVKDWCKWMDAQGWSVATKNLRLTTLRNFCKWISGEFGVPNIAENLRGWKDTKEHKRGFLSCGEMKQLLDVVDDSTLQGKRDKAIIGVLLTGGLRTVEVNRLRISDVIHNGGVTYLNVVGKGRDTGEHVKISRKAEQLICDWLTARQVDIAANANEPLFCSLSGNSFGKPISSNSVSTLCKKYLTKAGLKTKEIVAHSLRHSLATNSLMKGASLMEVQQQLRHVNLSTTQIYLHEAEKAANRCTELIADEIF